MKSAFLIDDLCDTSCAGNTHGDHNEYHGQHHQTHQNVHTVGEQREQITGLKGTSDNHVCTEPADQKDTGVYRKLHQWRVPYNNGFCLKKHIVDVAAGLGETLLLVIAADISFHNADRGYVLLNALI